MLGVSVVIPCYNAAPYLREALESVMNQDYAGPLEVLVGDDASSDGSREIAESFGAPVRVLCDPDSVNRGMSVARNRCLCVATQPLVAFLDADDVWLPGHLAGLAAAMQQRPELGLAYDKGYYLTDEGRAHCPIFAASHRPRVTPDELLLENCILPTQVLVRRQALTLVGLFDEDLRHSADHDLWLRILELFPAAHVPSYGFYYRCHPGQNSLSPCLWTDAETVLEKARKRYPYGRSALRKRKAVIAYRRGQIALQNRQLILAAYFLVKAGMLDPLRAAREVAGRIPLQPRGEKA